MDLLDIMRTRRSIRKYTGEEIPEEKLTRILQAGLLAQSSMGKRPCEFLVVKDRPMLVKLSQAKRRGAAMLAECGAAVAVFADSDLSDAWIEDSSIALTQMCLMAASENVGSCWVQMRMRKDADGGDAEQNAKEILGIEDPYRIVGILSLGMPNEEKPAYELDALQWEEKVHGL